MPLLKTFCTSSGEPVSTFFEIYGNPEAPNKLILSMGFMCTMEAWSFLKPALQSDLPAWQICVYDNRGCGRSVANPGKYTTTQMADDAIMLLKHLNWLQGDDAKVHVGGFSMGGMIAQKLALKLQRQNKLASLLLCCTGRKYLRGPDFISLVARFIFQYVVTFGIALFFVAHGAGLLGPDRIARMFIRACHSWRYLSMAPREQHELALLDQDERAAYDLQQPSNNYELLTLLYKLKPRKWLDSRPECIASQWFALITHFTSMQELTRLRNCRDIQITVQSATEDVLVPTESSTDLALALHANTIVLRGGHKAFKEEECDRFIHSLKAHLSASTASH